MAAMHPAEFFGTPVSVIDHAGRRWLTAEEAGRCLGYNEANARQGINNLFKRHEDEFTEEDTFVISLMTNPKGGNPNTRIFSATGCQKLGFFASTARAKDFRAWAARVLAGQAPVPLPAPQGKPPRVTRRLERQAFELFVAGHTGADIGKRLGVSRTVASLVLHGKYQFSPGAGACEATSELIAAVAARHLAVEQERLAAAQERIAQRYLSSANNQELARALEQVGRQLQRWPENALAAPTVED